MFEIDRPFLNGPQLMPAQYGAQPTLRAFVTSPLGEEVLPDQLLIRLDAATGVGEYDLSDSAGNCYERGEQCVYLHQDVSDNSSNKFFVAVAGKVHIDAQITTDQSQGTLEYVELREAIPGNRNVPYNAAALVPNGACLWIAHATFDTRRENGCNPLVANSCGNDRVCIPENAAGSDGTCQRSTSGGTNNAPCTRDVNGDSNCGLEYTCSKDDAPVCRRLCDLLGDDNTCPTGTMCSFYGYCEPWDPTTRDPAALGASCAINGARCGEKDRGWCFNATDAQSPPKPLPEGRKCHPFQRSRAACTEDDQELGYVDIKLPNSQNPNLLDRSIGTCVPAL